MMNGRMLLKSWMIHIPIRGEVRLLYFPDSEILQRSNHGRLLTVTCKERPTV
jgi:hypothetical protein